MSAKGIEVIARDIQEGVIYNQNGVKIPAFLVDHGAVKPAFGYRVDYAGRSVALSGDTPEDAVSDYTFAHGARCIQRSPARSYTSLTVLPQPN
jgi:ribonuclease Z